MTEQRRTVRKPRKAAPVNLLDEGDTVELSMTAEVKNKQGRSFWVKGGAQSTVRPGEDAEDAKQRLATFVTGYLYEQVAEYLS